MNTKQYLQTQIDQLRHELSVDIPADMQEAVSMGDLRENSEYTSALERQHYTSVRLEQLMHRLDVYNRFEQVVIPRDAVQIGSLVRLRDLKTNTLFYVKMVIGDIDDAVTSHDEITVASPLGSALLGKRVKDEVSVQTPSGTKHLRIVQIKPLDK
jgi:transcription elongation factor GreA